MTDRAQLACRLARRNNSGTRQTLSRTALASQHAARYRNCCRRLECRRLGGLSASVWLPAGCYRPNCHRLDCRRLEGLSVSASVWLPEGCCRLDCRRLDCRRLGGLSVSASVWLPADCCRLDCHRLDCHRPNCHRLDCRRLGGLSASASVWLSTDCRRSEAERALKSSANPDRFHPPANSCTKEDFDTMEDTNTVAQGTSRPVSARRGPKSADRAAGKRTVVL